MGLIGVRRTTIYRGRWAVWPGNWPQCGPAAGLGGRLWSAGSGLAGPGWVLKAVVQVLGDRGEPMRAKDIHAAVETSLGAPVAWSLVKASLAANVLGTSPCFVRVARGRYVLAG